MQAVGLMIYWVSGLARGDARYLLQGCVLEHAGQAEGSHYMRYGAHKHRSPS